MVLEQEIPRFFDWLLTNAILVFPLTLLVVATIGWLIGFLIAATRRGPVEGFYAVAKVIAGGVADIANFSLRRTVAMTMLAIRESFRRKVLIAFAVFVVVMLLAGWYLDVKSDQPARLYLSFVLTASNYLVLLLALFLSAFSLPSDFKNKTIHTIVTKPVRPLEIVLGRILGFTAVGTMLLAAMCVLSYFFVVRGLRHDHTVDVVAAAAAGDAGGGLVESGETSTDAHHSHTLEMDAEGYGVTDRVMGHQHQVRRLGEGPQAEYLVGPPEGMLQARVPKRGELRFLDRAGQPGTGINVGNEWMYRSYIEGGTLAAAIWTFDGVNERRYPDGFELELNLRVFRTHKGNIERGVRGSIFIQNPDPASRIKRSEEIPFTALEFDIDKQFVPRQLKAADEEGVVYDVDLFEDLTSEGRVEVVVRCSEPGQYFGMAPADVYILERDASFAWNFVKGYLTVWMQMLLVTSFGVMFSTFLSGAVAMMATLASLVLGFFSQFIADVATGAVMGGGPVESMIRMVKQLNVQTDMEVERNVATVVKAIDSILIQVISVVANLLPNYGDFNTVNWVAYGYNIEPALMGMRILQTLSYFLIVAMIGYFFMKTREVAA
jgi:hypothetical protein